MAGKEKPNAGLIITGRRPVGTDYRIVLDFGALYSAELVKKLKLKHVAHQGIDFNCPVESPVRAYRDGIIQIAHDNGDGLGNRIWIYHDLPEEKHAARSLYAHLSKMTWLAGHKVKEGELIGYSGDTGKVSGPHLHFELRLLPADVAIRPYFYANVDLGDIKERGEIE